jgi:cephalosporin hydroxylase
VIANFAIGSFLRKGNSVKTAAWDYLELHLKLAIDKNVQRTLLIVAKPDGYLKRCRR